MREKLTEVLGEYARQQIYYLPPIELLNIDGWKITYDIGEQVYSVYESNKVLYAHKNLREVVNVFYNQSPASVSDNAALLLWSKGQ